MMILPSEFTKQCSLFPSQTTSSFSFFIRYFSFSLTAEYSSIETLIFTVSAKVVECLYLQLTPTTGEMIPSASSLA